MSAPERIVRVDVQPRGYNVFISDGGLTGLGAKLREVSKARLTAVITDENVKPLHAEMALASLRNANFEPILLTVPAGEGSKSLARLSELYDALADARIDRWSPLVALGGGVVGDLTGFLASTWVRGVPFVQCPTTLEADVDASVGGKTGINHRSGKNMIGAFYQPLFVLIDTRTLATLSERDFRAGLAESVKHAVIRDAAFFEWHEHNADGVLAQTPAALIELVERNVRIKAEVVSADERETTGLRALLNFGHTVGHAIETTTARRRDPWRHGECVAIGMVAACEISVLAGRLTRDTAERVVRLLERLHLPTRAPFTGQHAELIDLMQSDKKSAHGKVRFVLADGIGRAGLYDDVQPAWIEAALRRVC
jgi:3-dehydroquinate synthase